LRKGTPARYAVRGLDVHLYSRELTVSEIIEKLCIEQTNASQQLAVLRNTNLISARKQGTSVYYSARNPAIFKLLDLTNEE